eukprot:CAMPEP_0170318550 /NCGR_PEP_ID=MMETSP0116_2-20130129/59972_1 /TAXON_ID=400756 /ORGANISM="Durinskia baltica, Strain CSIRO CS-38" /LENGTH=41 /DNA_ID= /DNA_START= /DNA_END= /DNA_ORIENTATION=
MDGVAVQCVRRQLQEFRAVTGHCGRGPLLHEQPDVALQTGV